MLKYSDFLTENKIYELLLESKLEFSDSFCRVLNQIKLPIANKILSLRNQDKDVQQNYIDTDDKTNDEVSFITDRKAKEIMKDKESLHKVIYSDRYLTANPSNNAIYVRLEFPRPDNLEYTPEVGDIGKILKETHGSAGKTYVLFECTDSDNESSIGKKVIINKSGLIEASEDVRKLWKTNRSKIKIGRIVRALLKSSQIEFTDKEIEEFVNAYKSTIDILNDAFNKFDVVSGKDLLYFYKLDNYAEESGTLGNSCMATVDSDFLYIYSGNPEQVKLVILYDSNGKIVDSRYKSGKIMGRALLWKLDDGEMFMDRIYTINDSDVELFKKFAERNDWWYKRRQDSSNKFIIDKGTDSKTNPILKTKLKNWDDEYPYVDSLTYFDSETGYISTHREFKIGEENFIKANKYLNSTGGSYDYLDDDDN